MELKHAGLAIADIGGYTKFIKFHETAPLHAQEVIAQLLEAVVELAGDLPGYRIERAAESYADLGGVDTVVFSPAASIAARARPLVPFAAKSN